MTGLKRGSVELLAHQDSGFESAVYQIVEDYDVKCQDVNINGKFEESLQGDNTAGYAIAFVSLFIMAASGIVIYSIFYLSVASCTQQNGQLQTIGMQKKQSLVERIKF